MKILRISMLLACLSIMAVSCTQQRHLISNASERKAMLEDFNSRREMLPEGNLFSIFDAEPAKISNMEREALQFLYAYMPLSDITDHSGEFFLDNVRTSFKAREEMPWGKDIPEREFRHFVLPVRVNNEDLDGCRMVFYEELKDRVKNLTLHDAVLEINHWCHEKVVYTPSDSRTSSPLASIRTAHGRCGEESTFAVSAFRAMGIPARQVYTPRWAHTDDNHAWVEAWVDGKWYFLGACEPEPVLNLAWFNAPVSRGMLMHTKVFGRYDGPEEKMSSTQVFTEINVTENYAPVAQLNVKAVDQNGKAVSDATIEFKIYNYAEYFTVSRKQTDKDGMCSLSAGKGDMVVWASKDGHFGFRKVTFGKDQTVSITLDRVRGDQFSEDLEIIPPAERPNAPKVTPEQRKENDRRFAEEDAIRNAYVGTFPTKKQIQEFAAENALSEKLTVEFVRASRGNYAEIMKFLKGLKGRRSQKEGLNLLQCVSQKDLRDTRAEILQDHLDHMPECQNDIERQYIRNPRIKNELLTAYKSALLKAMSEEKDFATAAQRVEFQKDPMKLASWVKGNIHLDPVCNLGGAPISPMGVWKSRTADVRSRNIFFVAMARTLGIPARINEISDKVQVFLPKGSRPGNYQVADIDFEATQQIIAPTGQLKLKFKPTEILDDPKYCTHFTLAKMTPEGSTQLMNYEEGDAAMSGEMTWNSLFRKGTSLDTGDYILVTGSRLANGGVLSNVTSFSIAEGKTTVVDLKVRESKTEVQVIGSFNSESRYSVPVTGAAHDQKSILEACGRGYFVVGVLGMGQEPTNHALRDIAAVRQGFEDWGRKVVLLFPNLKQYQDFMNSEFPERMPSTVVYGIDTDGSIQKQIATEMKFHDHTTLPMFIIGDTFNRVVFASQGYTIGLGEQILKISKKI